MGTYERGLTTKRIHTRSTMPALVAWLQSPRRCLWEPPDDGRVSAGLKSPLQGTVLPVSGYEPEHLVVEIRVGRRRVEQRTVKVEVLRDLTYRPKRGGDRLGCGKARDGTVSQE